MMEQLQLLQSTSQLKHPTPETTSFYVIKLVYNILYSQLWKAFIFKLLYIIVLVDYLFSLFIIIILIYIPSSQISEKEIT